MENFELVQPFYSQMVNPKYIIYRSRIDRDRFYFTFANGELLRLPSVTTILSNTLPMDDWLIRWISRWGYEQAMERKQQAAHYGTLFSIIASDFLKSGEIDLSTIEARVNTYKLANNITFNTDFWVQKLKEDLFALHSFVCDYHFEPIAIELPLVSLKYKFAGTLDAVGYLRIGSGVNGKVLKRDKETKRVLSVIDWKTGRHGFYRSHEAQLHLYKLLLEENYPELLQGLELRLFNWSPKEWENEDDAKYSFKDQTQSKEARRILNYIAIYQVEEEQKSHRFKIIEGVLKLGVNNGNLKYIDYSEIVRKKFGESNQVVAESNAKPITNEKGEPVEVPSDVIQAIESFFNQIKEEQ